jgi:hypothetical protein
MHIFTKNPTHLGDNLISLNYLRRIALGNPKITIKHYCPEVYIPQLLPILSGVFNLEIYSINFAPENSINIWIGYDNYYYSSLLKNNWVSFHLDFFKYLSTIINVTNPIQNKDDLLFDYPALNPEGKNFQNFDFLIINSTPLSGQIYDYDQNYLINLTSILINLGYSVVTTHPNGSRKSTMELGLTISDIGLLSSYASIIIGIPNGPMWTTFNIFNKSKVKFRIIWLSNEILQLMDNCICVKSSQELTDLLSSARII